MYVVCVCGGGGRVSAIWFLEKLQDLYWARKTEKSSACNLASKKSSEKGKHLIAFLLKIVTVSWIGLKENIYCSDFFIEKLVATKP